MTQQFETTVADHFLGCIPPIQLFATFAESGPMFVVFNSCREIFYQCSGEQSSTFPLRQRIVAIIWTPSACDAIYGWPQSTPSISSATTISKLFEHHKHHAI